MKFFDEMRMPQNAHALTLNREDLPELIASGVPYSLNSRSVSDICRTTLSQKQIIVGYWATPNGDPFPDFIAVRDEDYDDTQAWLSAFLTGFAPVSQWCRIWRLSALSRIERVMQTPALRSRLGSWVGAILADFGSHGAIPSLKDVSGAAALTSSNFCAARALAIWQSYDGFEELAKRHDALSARPEGNRPSAAEHYLPLWYVLAGEQWESKQPLDARALEPIKQLINDITTVDYLPQEMTVEIAEALGREYRLPDLQRCAMGPQGQRVDALDRLAGQLLNGPKSVSSRAIMGFGASLVDPGAAILPELLRRYSSAFPTAAVWAGAFAGIWLPIRVFSEHSGLGRIIAKEILAPSDIFTKPSADISFDELSRWTGGSFSGGKFPVRGLMARSLFVELAPGISVPIASRTDSSRTESSSQRSSPRQPSLDLDVANKSLNENNQRALKDVQSLEEDIISRIVRLELIIGEITGQAIKSPKSGTKLRGKRT